MFFMNLYNALIIYTRQCSGHRLHKHKRGYARKHSLFLFYKANGMNNILIIDDDEDDRLIFCEAVRKAAPTFNCLTAASCVESLQLLSTLGSVPEYIFLDMHLPGMDGKETLDRIRSIVEVKKVIIYTGSIDPSNIPKFKLAGANEVLIKPDTFNGLCKSLDLIINCDRVDAN
jgi:CheY-like chemotaxis protein